MICSFSIGTGVQEIKNRYLPGVRPSTTNSATCRHKSDSNRQEWGIPGIKLFPNLQLIKRLEG